MRTDGAHRARRGDGSRRRAGLSAAVLLLVAAASVRAADQDKTGSTNALAGLAPVWSLAGGWTAVAADPTAAVAYAVSSDRALVAVDASGRKRADRPLGQGARILRAATLDPDGGSSLLGFTRWGPSLIAWDTGGNVRWTWSNGQGINDVRAFDLDDDGADEIIVGCTGGEAVTVLDHTGAVRWTGGELRNVWHVSACDLDGNDSLAVVCTSGLGEVHIYDADGVRLRDLNPACYANLVRAMTSGLAEHKALLLTAGSVEEREELLALDSRGEQQWSVRLASNGPGRIDSAEAANTRPWLAVGMRDGLVVIVDTRRGEIVAQASGQGRFPQVAWIAADRDAAPLLLVASGSALNAFRVTAADGEGMLQAARSGPRDGGAVERR